MIEQNLVGIKETPSDRADSLGSSLANEAARIEKLAAAIVPYMEHLVSAADQTNHVHASDMLTLVSLCRQAYSRDTMHEDLRGVLPTLADLISKIYSAAEREVVNTALTKLSTHMSWLQLMVKYGFAHQEVSGPNQFHTYESFANACRALVSGRWQVDFEQIHRMALANLDFLDDLEFFSPQTHHKFRNLFHDALRACSQTCPSED